MSACSNLIAAIEHAMDWLESQALKANKKTTEDIIAQYEAELDDEVEAVYDGSEDQQEFEDNVKKILAALALLMYLAATGLSEDDLDEEDQAAIDEWVTDQAQYVGGLAQAVSEAGQAEGETATALQAAIETRVGYWSNSLAVFGAVAAGSTEAGGNRIGQWRLGGTKEHCETCAGLAEGEPHKVSWFVENGYLPREPGSPTLECNGWNCDCGVYDVITGEQLL